MIGFVLGSAQLVVYSMYKNKSKVQKQVKISNADGAIIERTNEEDGDHAEEEKRLKGTRKLNKNKSLPRPPVNRLYSSKNLMKALSWGPYGLNSSNNFPQEDDDDVEIENNLP